GEAEVKALRAVLLGADFYPVRMAAAISLGEIGGPEATAALTEGYRASADPRVRRVCVFMTGRLAEGQAAGSAQSETLEFLRSVLEEDQSYFVGVAAVRALANLGGDQAYDILVSSLSRASWQEVIAAAIFHGFEHGSPWAKEKHLIDLAID